MKILVVAATQFEIAPFIKLNPGIDTLITGVGIPSTVYYLSKKLLLEKYDLVIQAGIAGTFTKEIKLGDVIAVELDVFADIGVEENKKFKTLFNLGFNDFEEFPFRCGRLFNDLENFQFLNLKVATAVTVNKISDRKKHTKQLNKIFGADIESMEGAAFHYVCIQQNVAFIQIRSVSNKVGERDKTKWKIKDAVENLNNELIKLIDTVK